jgi:hypothetical protein
MSDITSGFWTSIRGSHIRSHIRRREDAESAPRSLADHLSSLLACAYMRLKLFTAWRSVVKAQIGILTG